MNYLAVSFSHKNSDIKTREKLAFTDSSKEIVLRALYDVSAINEVLIIGTCNRVEVLASVKETTAALSEIFEKLSQHSGLSIDELEGRADTFENEGAIHHLFAVTSSLDSVVIGETQIAGQVKESLKFAYELGVCAQKLSRAVHFAFRCAAMVRNETQIAKKPVSVASAAVDKAKNIFGTLDGKTAVVVGTGEMGELASRHLLAQNCKVVLVSRTNERAQTVASQLGCGVEGCEISQLKNLLNTHELLFSASGAQHAIINSQMVEKRDFERLWFDISVPRDIDDPMCEGVTVVTVDDLKDIVDANINSRAESARLAYSIVGRFTQDFFKWVNTLSVDPIIKEMRAKAEQCATDELARAVKKGFIPKEMQDAVLQVLNGSFKKFLHAPTVNLKALAASPKLDGVVESLRYLHEFEDEKVEPSGYRCEQQNEGEK